MKTKIIYLLLGTLGLLCGSWAQADTCTISALPAVSTGYSGGAVTVQSSVTVNCVRSAGDPNNVPYAYTVGVDNGLNSGGLNPNKAKLIANINYDTYQAGSCSPLWGTTAQTDRLAFSLTLSGNSVGSATVNYWICIPAGQSVPLGIYTDTLDVIVYRQVGTVATSRASQTLPISIDTAAVCSMTTIPNIAMAYTAFSAAAVTATTTFGVTCSSALAYTVALDRTSDVAVGVNYAVALSSPGGTGTGAQQNYTVTVTAAADQAGACATASCVGSQATPHTVTVTY